VQSFAGKLVLKEKSIEAILFSLGEMAIRTSQGAQSGGGQCRLDA